MILILYVQFHWRFNEDGSGHDVGFVVGVQVVQEVARILLRDVDILWSAVEGGFSDIIF